MSWKDELTRLRSRSPRERALAIHAFLLLGLFRGATLLLPFAWVARVLRLEGRPPGEPVRPFPPAELRGTGAAEVRWAVRAAARRTPWQSTCLPQALAALVLLRRQRLDGILYLGVATAGETGGETGGLKAHAWLGLRGYVVVGGRGLAAFEPISAFVRRGVAAPGG